MGAVLDSSQSLRERKAGTSRQAYPREKKLEKAEAEGLK